MREIKVKGCDGCPFCYAEAGIQEGKWNCSGTTLKDVKFPVINFPTDIPPKNCPLLAGDVVVKLEK